MSLQWRTLIDLSVLNQPSHLGEINSYNHPSILQVLHTWREKRCPQHWLWTKTTTKCLPAGSMHCSWRDADEFLKNTKCRVCLRVMSVPRSTNPSLSSCALGGSTSPPLPGWKHCPAWEPLRTPDYSSPESHPVPPLHSYPSFQLFVFTTHPSPLPDGSLLCYSLEMSYTAVHSAVQGMQVVWTSKWTSKWTTLVSGSLHSSPWLCNWYKGTQWSCLHPIHPHILTWHLRPWYFLTKNSSLPWFFNYSNKINKSLTPSPKHPVCLTHCLISIV